MAEAKHNSDLMDNTRGTSVHYNDNICLLHVESDGWLHISREAAEYDKSVKAVALGTLVDKACFRITSKSRTANRNAVVSEGDSICLLGENGL